MTVVADRETPSLDPGTSIFSRILVGIDASEASLEAAEQAARLVEPAGDLSELGLGRGAGLFLVLQRLGELVQFGAGEHAGDPGGLVEGRGHGARPSAERFSMIGWEAGEGRDDGRDRHRPGG